MRARTAVFLVAALATACSKQHPGAGRGGPKILAHVPADTPYVFASLDPWPREVVEQYLADSRPQLDQAIASMRAAPDAGGPGARFVLALFEEIAADFTVAGIEKNGFNPRARAAFYGLGLLPAARVEILDAARVEALVERALTKSGFTLPRESYRDRRYWAFRPTPEVTVVVALHAGELIVGVAPSSMLARVLPLLYGDQRLGPSLAETGGLEKLAVEKGLGRQFVGYVDLMAAAAALTDETRPLVRDTLAALGAVPPAASCRPELARLASLSPRWLMSASWIPPRQATGSVVMELDATVARDLMTARATVPGVGAPLGTATLSFGAAVDLGRLLDLMRRGAESVLRNPYRCDALAWVNEAADELAQELAPGKVPGWASELRGFVAVLESVEPGLAFPTIKAHGLLAASDPIQLIDLAKRGISQLSGLEIPPDGRPVPIPGGLIPLMTGHVAMKGQLLGLSLGPGSELQLVQLMSTPPLPSQPVFAMAFDAAKFRELMKTVGSMTGAADPGAQLGGAQGSITFLVELDARGMVMRFDQTR
jgi:hypothetical protein